MTIFSKSCLAFTTLAAYSALTTQSFFRKSSVQPRVWSSLFHGSPTFASAMGLPDNVKSISFLDASSAKNIDIKLMKMPGFTLDQLMELAGIK